MVGIPKARPKKDAQPVKRGSKKSDPLDWLEESELVPRSGTPGVDNIDRRVRRMRGAVYALLGLGCLAILGLVSNLSSTPLVPTAITPQLTSPGRNVATTAMQAWLNESPSPLPNATILSWNGATTVTGVGGSDEVDTFTLAQPFTTASSPQTMYHYYSAVIEISLAGLIPVGGPGISTLPGTNTNNPTTPNPWPSITTAAQSTSVSSAVSQSISGWLSAYTSGSPSQLAIAVGDPSSTHHYTPLFGVAAAQYTMVTATPREAPNSAPASNNSAPNAEIVEINLDLQWNGEKGMNGLGAVNGPLTTEDLLIERANTPAPIVVAWGVPGSGPSLVPYQNG